MVKNQIDENIYKYIQMCRQLGIRFSDGKILAESEFLRNKSGSNHFLCFNRKKYSNSDSFFYFTVFFRLIKRIVQLFAYQ